MNAKKSAQKKTSANVVVDVTSAQEAWNEYKLSDGTTLRLKTVVVEVERSNEKYNAEGDPVYSVKSATLVDARVPSKLKKKQR